MATKVFVSPGVYTSEKDLSYITRQVGVTTLGLVGETTIGPAFQPIFISNYGEFESFFGGTNATKFRGNGKPKYELPYIAKSYLSQSNQLYVTRLLGFSGYNAGKAWGIKIVNVTGDTTFNNTFIGVIRSKASYSGEVLNFKTSALKFNPAVSGATSDYKADFVLSGTSSTPFTINASLDKNKKNYLPNVIGRSNSESNTNIYLDEFYGEFLDKNASKAKGLDIQLVEINDNFKNYKTEYKSAVTPYVLSQVIGTEMRKLFRFHTISDGDSANKQIKISIRNINFDNKEFDVIIRSFYDTDARPIILESYSRCSMDSFSDNFVGKKIGTIDGDYPSKSSLVLIEFDDVEKTNNDYPAGFGGYVSRKDLVSNNTTGLVTYEKAYGPDENKRKKYLGLSNVNDTDLFKFKGLDSAGNSWTGKTKGFHMDVDAVSASSSVGEVLETGTFKFDDTNYSEIYSRKFTFAPQGGFDGWDIYRDSRTNTDDYKYNKPNASGFTNRPMDDGEKGITSDYYAYLEGIQTLRNPEAFNINILTTPGIDISENPGLTEATIIMVEEERADCIYIATIPDVDGGNEPMSADEAASLTEYYDSNYTCTYWPWVQTSDTENNVYIYLPPTKDVVRNMALTDNIAFPWFASAGMQRGSVNGIKARKKLTNAERETLQLGRVNPINTFATEGVKIWGNRTLQQKESALSSINVRRMLLQARKLISAVSNRLIFEQNDNVVRNQFLGLVNPILENMRKERGLIDFRVSVSNSPEDYDRKQLTGQIFIKPTNALEVIQLEFVVTNQGASFENI